MPKKEEDSLVVDRVREQIQVIVEDELSRLFDEKKSLDGRVEEVRKRIEALLQNYRDVERLLGKVAGLSIMGLMNNSAKVQEIAFNEGGCNSVIIYSSDRDQAQITVQVEGKDVFYQHPAGSKFVLNPKKKYRLLVAFIEKEEV